MQLADHDALVQVTRRGPIPTWTLEGVEAVRTVPVRERFSATAPAALREAAIAGLGVALLSDRHIRPEMEIIRTHLPPPPDLAYVVRRARKSRNPALDSLIAEVEAEVSRYGGLSLAV